MMQNRIYLALIQYSLGYLDGNDERYWLIHLYNGLSREFDFLHNWYVKVFFDSVFLGTFDTTPDYYQDIDTFELTMKIQNEMSFAEAYEKLKKAEMEYIEYCRSK